jgi:hypothetical protein
LYFVDQAGQTADGGKVAGEVFRKFAVLEALCGHLGGKGVFSSAFAVRYREVTKNLPVFDLAEDEALW